MKAINGAYLALIMLFIFMATVLVCKYGTDKIIRAQPNSYVPQLEINEGE